MTAERIEWMGFIDAAASKGFSTACAGPAASIDIVANTKP